MTITIPWEDGTEDNIYIDYTDVINPIITSDPNLNHITRRKVIKYNTTQTTPVSILYLAIEQRFDGIIVPMFETTVATLDNISSGF